MSRTFDLADRLVYYALTYLDKHGPTSTAELFSAIKRDMTFNEWESVVYPKTGFIRWERMLYSFSVDLTKAEWITKKRKVWTLTPAGKHALETLKTPAALRAEAIRLWKIWFATPADELKRRKAAARAEKEAAEAKTHKK
ncbi:MAG: hypothetical protein FWF34_01885 [Alphaproteobacteria bacterium]|nr:hypothetical protein [Alphaproteobacteria bacterium]MCL2889983.1 hypothetical protein [Alphaproteobacteria bacterium]